LNIALNEPENSLPPQMLPALASLIAETRLYSQICLTSFDGGGGDAVERLG
jgi:predicted ATPase